MTLDVLQIRRSGRHAPRPSRAAVADRVALWNLLAPPGTLIRYFPTWGKWALAREDTTRAPATIMSSGLPVLWLENTRGCVSAWHCEPLELAGSKELRPVRPSQPGFYWYRRPGREWALVEVFTLHTGSALLRVRFAGAGADGLGKPLTFVCFPRQDDFRGPLDPGDPDKFRPAREDATRQDTPCDESDNLLPLREILGTEEVGC